MLMSLLALVFLLPTLLHAQGIEQPGAYSVIASTCTIDEHDQPILALGGTDVTFRATQVSRRQPGRGLLASVVRCPVVDVSGTGHPDWNTLFVGYRDPDGGAGDQHRVRVRLLQIGRPGGAKTALTDFDSRRWPETDRTERAIRFEGALNVQQYSYVLEVSLYRGDLRGNPRLWHLRLATVR